MIDKVRVRNFRCLHDVDVPLGPLNFLVGPNNSGKSSFVDAVRLLSRCVSASSTADVFAESNGGPSPEGERKVRFQNIVPRGDRESCLEYECRFTWVGADGTDRKGRHVASLGLARQPGQGADNVRFVKESLFVTLPDGREVLRSEASNRERSILVEGPGGADPDGFPEFREALSTTPVYKLVPERISLSCSSAAEDVRLDGDGYGLAGWLNKFRNEHPSGFDQIQDILRKLVPGMSNVSFPSLPQGIMTILFHEKWGAKVFATEASDGLLLFLGYLSIAYAHSPVAVVPLEEPETGVHPGRLRDIVHLLRAMSRGEFGLPPVQVIATSHSPYLLDWCSKEEVVVFARDDAGEVRTKLLTDIPDVDDRIEDFESLGDFLYSVGEGLCESRS